MGEQFEQVQPRATTGTFQTPASLRQHDEEIVPLIKVLTDHETFLNVLRQELKGEQLFQDEQGNKFWVQLDKPVFIRLDEQDRPLKIMNERTKKMEFVPNDEGINSVMQTLKSCGMNPVAPLTTINENEIRADLLEMESKLAVLLTVKRKKWGVDKAEYPVVLGNLKVLIKDARYRSLDGVVLKALRTITSRLESSNDAQKVKGANSPYL